MCLMTPGGAAFSFFSKHEGATEGAPGGAECVSFPGHKGARDAGPGGAGSSFFSERKGATEGAVTIDTAAGALGSICLIGARRCSVSPHTEHTNVRRSNPGGQSSPITCSGRVAAGPG